jgi:phosphoglycerate dehydrogenase-like enzyme
VRRPRVLLAFEPREPEEAQAVEDELGAIADLFWLSDSLGPAEVPLEEIDALVFFQWPRALDESLARMRRLSFVQRVPAGVEGVPFAKLRDFSMNVQVAGGSGSNAPWVAEHAIALLLAAAKRIPFHDRSMRKGEFHQMDVMSKELRGATLAVLGMGNIGRRVAEIARALGMNVLGVSRTPGPDVVGGLEVLDEVLGRSDAVVISLPLSTQTQDLFDRKRLQRMRPASILVNVARGRIIDPQALYEHATLHPDFTAALDVWWTYPKPGQVFAESPPIHELPNVIMTPHNAAMVPRYRERMVRHAARNVKRVFEGGEPSGLVDPQDYL